MFGQFSSASSAKDQAYPRFLPDWLRQGRGRSVGLALFAFINGGISTALMALLAYWSRSPLVFPSLGPTAFLLFHRPLAPAASPRNCVAGHLIAILAGWASLSLLGLTNVPSILDEGVTGPRVAAAALSVGLTSGLMVLFDVPHPPAGATTLIVSLGLIHEPAKYPILMAGVLLMLVQGFVLNRFAGLPYPLWRPVDLETRKQYPSFV